MRTQLHVSVQGSAQLMKDSADIKELKAEMLALKSNEAYELKRQALVIDELKSHMNVSEERQREMTRQASILDDLKAQLTNTNDMSVALIFRYDALSIADAAF